jgi:VanZ family protein
MVRSGYSGALEHAVAYAIAAAVFALAYPVWSKWRIALGLCFYAALLELGQSWVPGRGAALIDWASGAAGACLVLIPLWLRSVQARES